MLVYFRKVFWFFEILRNIWMVFAFFNHFGNSGFPCRDYTRSSKEVCKTSIKTESFKWYVCSSHVDRSGGILLQWTFKLLSVTNTTRKTQLRQWIFQTSNTQNEMLKTLLQDSVQDTNGNTELKNSWGANSTIVFANNCVVFFHH